MTTNQCNCKSCGAPLDLSVKSCGYCAAPLNSYSSNNAYHDTQNADGDFQIKLHKILYGYAVMRPEQAVFSVS